ncbi:MAG: hypothetical protein WBY94_22525 [Polyangiaceae bacterium]
MDRYARADAMVRTTLSLAGAAMRASYVESVIRTWNIEAVARALNVVCERAEQAEASSREALLAIVDALNAQGMDAIVQRLREEVAGDSLLALERLVRSPDAAAAASPSLIPPRGDARDPAATLGRRKFLARRPDRETMQRLLGDPHPDVIRSVLRNPRLTEDDVVRLAARRPGRGQVLAEVARSTKWSHRPRVRVALVANPSTPTEIAARIAGLLLRPELDLVARLPGVPRSVRAVCLEHLQRRPPVEITAQRAGKLH